MKNFIPVCGLMAVVVGSVVGSAHAEMNNMDASNKQAAELTAGVTMNRLAVIVDTKAMAAANTAPASKAEAFGAPVMQGARYFSAGESRLKAQALSSAIRTNRLGGAKLTQPNQRKSALLAGRPTRVNKVGVGNSASAKMMQTLRTSKLRLTAGEKAQAKVDTGSFFNTSNLRALTTQSKN
ncbi:MAG TPA: hypothetical protein VF719_01680 [Abditibacteriaceae bacterium]|jgi:hypothetical protein